MCNYVYCFVKLLFVEKKRKKNEFHFLVPENFHKKFDLDRQSSF